MPVDPSPEPVPKPSKNTQSSEDALLQAARLYEQGDYPQVQAAVQRLLQQEPDNLQARLLLGKTWMVQGYPSEAAFQFRQILARWPNHAEASACFESIRRIVAAVDAIRSTNPRELQLDVRRHVVVLTLVGMMAPYSEDENLREAFDRLTVVVARLIQLGLMGCVADLTRVDFVTSYFLGMLLEWRRRTLGEGRAMAICVGRPEIRDLLVSSRISRLIPLMESMEEAIDYVHVASGRLP